MLAPVWARTDDYGMLCCMEYWNGEVLGLEWECDDVVQIGRLPPCAVLVDKQNNRGKLAIM
jgi:hypothetical protein